VIDGLLAGRPVRAFVDRTVSPIYTVDVARHNAADREPCGIGRLPLHEQRFYHLVFAGAADGRHT
jgi:hypothetical protein